MKRLCLIFFTSIFLLTSCATKVSSITDDVDSHLEEQEGYLLIAVDTNFNLKELQIDGTKFVKFTAEDLRRGENYILVNLPAGDYSISRVKLNSSMRLQGFEDDIWDFSVKENMISYVGHLEIETISFWYWGYSVMNLANNSSIAFEYLDENYPSILKNRKVQYQGPGEDDFFNVIYSTDD